MSLRPAEEPECGACEAEGVSTRIDGRPRNLGGFDVRRILPARARRTVGPFIFFDHMGPATLAAGQGLDVPPHPHIGLATVTYLFEGEILHRDSLGSEQPIRPGAINWMTAGRGIVHSERSPDGERARESRVHGIQAWVALPREHEEAEPAFRHHPADTLPELERNGARLRLLAGSAWNASAPVATCSPLFYAEAHVPAGASVELPRDHAERAAYVVEGRIRCGHEAAGPGRMLVLEPSARPLLQAETDAHLMLLGGAPLDGERHIWWNFVSSRRERIEDARRAWAESRFPTVPGDEHERVPLPE